MTRLWVGENHMGNGKIATLSFHLYIAKAELRLVPPGPRGNSAVPQLRIRDFLFFSDGSGGVPPVPPNILNSETRGLSKY